MNKNSLTTAVIAGIAGVAGIANMASAVNLNPDGLGQVLLYPYYTVNAGQQTLLSVVNTTAVGKAVKVRFLEGYNSREVLDFNLFLSPFDVWTADVFALSDLSSGLGSGAGIFTNDNSCTAPVLKESTSGAQSYVAFRTYTFSGTNSDTGPTDASRTREGHFEMITMADIVDGSPLSVDTTHVNSVPPGCGTANSNPTPAEAAFEAGTAIVAPTSGLFGSAEVVNTVEWYVLHVQRRRSRWLYAPPLCRRRPASLTPSLAQVNPPTSYVFDDGVLLTSHIRPAPRSMRSARSSWPRTSTTNTKRMPAATVRIGFSTSRPSASTSIRPSVFTSTRYCAVRRDLWRKRTMVCLAQSSAS